MPESIPSLWPSSINVDVQSPLTILKVQAGALGKVTRGILQGTVETETVDDTEHHRLVVIAPAANSFRQTLLVAVHKKNLPYPVTVRASVFIHLRTGEEQYPDAASDIQFQEYVAIVLKSNEVQSTIHSLLSLSNEAKGKQP